MSANRDCIIGRRAFTDGSTRDVFLDAEGQYVLDDHGAQVRGCGYWTMRRTRHSWW